jgi:hypothetical protein
MAIRTTRQAGDEDIDPLALDGRGELLGRVAVLDA